MLQVTHVNHSLVILCDKKKIIDKVQQGSLFFFFNSYWNIIIEYKNDQL